MSNSRTFLSSVYTAPPDNCRSFVSAAAALTVVICSPAALMSIWSLSSL